MRKALFPVMALVLTVVVALTVGVQQASATPGENGPVIFRGTIASDEQCSVYSICYGDCFCPVNLTQVIDDPNGLLEGVSSLDVCYGYEPMDLKEGETVEVYGYCWYGECPLQYCGRVTVSGDPYYVVRLPAPTPTPTPEAGVGGTALPTDKVGLMLPWLLGGVALVLGGLVVLMWRRGGNARQLR